MRRQPYHDPHGQGGEREVSEGPGDEGGADASGWGQHLHF